MWNLHAWKSQFLSGFGPGVRKGLNYIGFASLRDAGSKFDIAIKRSTQGHHSNKICRAGSSIPMFQIFDLLNAEKILKGHYHIWALQHVMWRALKHLNRSCSPDSWKLALMGLTALQQRMFKSTIVCPGQSQTMTSGTHMYTCTHRVDCIIQFIDCNGFYKIFHTKALVSTRPRHKGCQGQTRSSFMQTL